MKMQRRDKKKSDDAVMEDGETRNGEEDEPTESGIDSFSVSSQTWLADVLRVEIF